MIKNKIIPYLLLGILLAACSSNGHKNDEKQDNLSRTEDSTTVNNSVSDDLETANKGESTNDFDINSIPITELDIGDFPFFSLPERVVFTNKPLERDYDELYFPIKGNFQLLKGRIFKAFVTADQHAGTEWSAPYFYQSYDDVITKAGGVRVNEEKIGKQQQDYLQENASYLGEEGSLDYSEKVYTYVIRRPDNANVYIQLSAYSAGGAIQILQEKAL